MTSVCAALCPTRPLAPGIATAPVRVESSCTWCQCPVAVLFTCVATAQEGSAPEKREH